MTKKAIVCFGALAIIAVAAGATAHVRTFQRLGGAGIRTTPIAGKLNVNIVLPEDVPGYQSKALEVDKLVYQYLPPDSSVVQRAYSNDANFGTTLTVVLMGLDRSSIHKPQYCLPSQGWSIYRTEEVQVPMVQPRPYSLPVMKLYASKEVQHEGRKQKASVIYTYWFVTEGKYTSKDGWGGWMWSMASTLLRTGTLERWAYISCTTVCVPGSEDAVFEQMEQFIARAVPRFQLVPAAPSDRADASLPR